MLINEYILKVVSRCNLNCSYCYMYNMGDNTYLKQPKFISLEIIKAFSTRVKNQCVKNNLKVASVIFHGGEPLLIEKSFYRKAVEIINENLIGIEVNYGIQTNGTLLDEEWCILMKELNIQIGISIDGTENFHNQYRLYHNNRGSFNDVLRGIKIRDKIDTGGLISVINIQIPPEELYNFFLSINAKSINILLPDNHFDNLPYAIRDLSDFHETPYGDWMISLFKCWIKTESALRPHITFFENIISIILGYKKGDELIGKRINKAVTIETDGAIEVVDPLRICENGFTRNTLNVLNDEISEIEKEQVYQEYYYSHSMLCAKCESCPIQNVCGSGYLAHRYSKANRFDNPSIYCKDLMKLITFIQNYVIECFPESTIDKLGLKPISYLEAFNYVNFKESIYEN